MTTIMISGAEHFTPSEARRERRTCPRRNPSTLKSGPTPTGSRPTSTMWMRLTDGGAHRYCSAPWLLHKPFLMGRHCWSNTFPVHNWDSDSPDCYIRLLLPTL